MSRNGAFTQVVGTQLKKGKVLKCNAVHFLYHQKSIIGEEEKENVSEAKSKSGEEGTAGERTVSGSGR